LKSKYTYLNLDFNQPQNKQTNKMSIPTMETHKELRLQEAYVDNLSVKLSSYFIHKSNNDDDISDVLRLHKQPTEYIQEITNALDILFEEVPPTEYPFYVYRGVEKKYYLNLSGFCSTSLDIEKSLNYTENGYIMKILVPVGSKVIPLYRIGVFGMIREHEILLDRKNTSIIDHNPKETHNGVTVYNVVYEQK